MCSFVEPMKGLGSPPVSAGHEGQSDKANLLIGEFSLEERKQPSSLSILAAN